MSDRSPERDWPQEWGPAGIPPQPRPSRLRRTAGGRLSPAVAAAVAVGVIAAPFGVAATGDALREGQRNGTTTRETEIIGRFNATTGPKGGYVTRQSNIQTGSRAGGGAIYGCRGAAGGTAAGSAPCLRATNLANGFAFELASNNGPTGFFDVTNTTTPPFITDGRGLVDNLNADMVDGKSASEFLGATAKAADAELLDGRDSSTFSERLFAVIDANGNVLAQRGLASTANTRSEEGFYTLTWDRDVRNCAAVGSIGAGNGGLAGGRILSVNKDFFPPGEENVNVRTQFFNGADFVDDDARFDVTLVC